MVRLSGKVASVIDAEKLFNNFASITDAIFGKKKSTKFL